ncbi:MAG TPA: class I SAM-dependent methyltransferase [Chryseolinea sp.]|nr:class I SAM-dependent methyltransferase [Chryseolinea sp.]
MSEKFFQLKSFITYWLNAVDAHSLHSPFFYNLYTKVITSTEDDPKFNSIEEIRNSLLKDERIIAINDLGSGSQVLKTTSRRISDIARSSLSPAKYARIYARLVSYFKCKTVFELGTSFGINALYLSAPEESNVTSFEGSAEILNIARESFKTFQAQNIRVIEGNLDSTLQQQVESTDEIQLVFMDANHRYEPTMKYFEILSEKLNKQSIVVVDDIHYSKEMERAWTELKQHRLIHASADLYRCGILFFDPSLNNQHVVLQC